MAKFNKCKDCGDTNPAEWVGSSNSLCRECADTREDRRRAEIDAHYDAVDKRRESKGLPPLGNRSAMVGLAVVAAFAGSVGGRR